MKKGFTLIELLAVIAILAVISVIAYPKVIDTIGASRLTAYNVSKSNIVDAAKLKYLADVNSTSITEYTVQDLIDTGYIKKGTKNPLTDEEYDNNTKVLITNNNGVIKYEYIEGKTLYDYVSTKSEKENVYKVNNEFIYKGKDSLNYVSFNKEIYRLVKVDMYRCAYLVKETDEKIDKQNIAEYEKSYTNDNFDEEVRNKLFSDASIISLELYNQTILNNASYINMDNNDWIKDNNEYKVMTMNNEFTSVDSAKTYIVLKLNGNVTVSGGNGTQLKPYVLN
ncbi:prepilin-type N-terminal cleavage/methylation domain-containing protein [Clostridium sp. CAG:433]|nr:prepilin-type N-terminal cleavage/methylation domain-containing protein [Clostridium sp. CAG:433]